MATPILTRTIGLHSPPEGLPTFAADDNVASLPRLFFLRPAPIGLLLTEWFEAIFHLLLAGVRSQVKRLLLCFHRLAALA